MIILAVLSDYLRYCRQQIKTIESKDNLTEKDMRRLDLLRLRMTILSELKLEVQDNREEYRNAEIGYNIKKGTVR